MERILIEMIRVAEERILNRKLTAITKGNNARALDRVEIATHGWFHSKQTHELYRYKEGILRRTHEKTEKGFSHIIFGKYSQRIQNRYR